MLSRLGLGWVLTCATSIACAEDATLRQSARAVSAADVTQWLVALLVVLMVFAVVVWLLRKTGSFSPAGKSQLALLGGLSLGMRERLVLVKVGDKQILLGVTPGRIDNLMTLEGEQRLFQNSERSYDSPTFAAKLQQVMQGRNNV
jgi:flagellar protein FliO/FliZ